VFQPDPTVPFVPATRDQVVAIIESLNHPQISIPGKEPQAVQAHLCGLRNASGSFSIVVALHLPRSGESVIYFHEPREISLEGYRQAEAEGLHFLESMGFMLDNLHYRDMSPELKDQTLQRVALFSPPRPPSVASEHGDPGLRPQGGSLALFLASF
jgi:hypothetical protein